MKKLLFFVFTLLFFNAFSTTRLYADYYSESNTVKTIIGDGKDTSGGGTGGEDLLKIGGDVKAAYDACENGTTYDKPGLDSCLDAKFKELGYNDAQITAFNTRRPGTVYGCTQCVGYVALALALMTGDVGALASINGNPLPNASSVAHYDNFTISGSISTASYKKINDANAKPGDIAVKDDGGDGHILIVKEMLGAQFVALEANGTPCTITDTRHIEWKQLGYVFYSKQ